MYYLEHISRMITTSLNSRDEGIQCIWKVLEWVVAVFDYTQLEKSNYGFHPEVFVANGDCDVIYQGQIDNSVRNSLIQHDTVIMLKMLAQCQWMIKISILE